ncbi:hypothetical protein [uncultured Bacteroides sp.]|uniref:hypothetical protein n=1 Tax=uncultured Bacteroides sp. TaxID=162156 RepID=UPI002638CE27|nr:hypothetical protein [uncultured Bacteroides sp.]
MSTFFIPFSAASARHAKARPERFLHPACKNNDLLPNNEVFEHNVSETEPKPFRFTPFTPLRRPFDASGFRQKSGRRRKKIREMLADTKFWLPLQPHSQAKASETAKRCGSSAG